MSVDASKTKKELIHEIEQLQKENERLKYLEEALQENEGSFKSLVQNIPDLVARYDKKLRHLFVNTTVLTQSGLKEEAFLFKTTLEAGYPESVAKPWMDKIGSVFKTKEIQTHYEEFQLPGGAACFHSILAPEFDRKGQVKSVVALTRNITELKRAERKLQQYTNHLEKAKRELEEFAYVASHDLKAPLTNLLSLISLLDEADAIEEDHIEIFEKVKTSTEQIRSKLFALNDVIALKEGLGSRKEKISFEVMFGQITESIAEQIKKINAEIKTDFSECTYIDYPPLHLQSIMQNLLTNALKYRQPDKRLTIEIKTKRTNEKVCLTFKDNGMGFDARKYGKKATGLFKRLHTHVEGKGVGLYIIQSIVNSHGGKIEIISEPNKGATFNIYL